MARSRFPAALSLARTSISLGLLLGAGCGGDPALVTASPAPSAKGTDAEASGSVTVAAAAPSGAPSAEPSAGPLPSAAPRFRAVAPRAQHASPLEPPLGARAEAGAWLCKAWERFGAPQGRGEDDLRFDLHDETAGVDLAIWAAPNGEIRTGTLGKHGKTSAEIAEIAAALRDFLSGAAPRDCRATFTNEAEARTIGVRNGAPFAEDATFEDALGAQLRRVGWAASVDPKDYGGKSFEADDRALYFWKEAKSAERKAHPEAIPALAQALLRWLGRTKETMNPAWLSPLGKRATCQFIKEVRAVVPLAEKADKTFADSAQAAFCR